MSRTHAAQRCGLWLLALLSLGAGADDAAFDYRLQPQAVAPDVYVFVGRREDFNVANGGNIVNTGFIVGRDGVVVIDSGPSRRYGEQMRRAIATVSALPPRLLLDTHHHPDHFLGNQAYADIAIAALPGTAADIARDGNAFAENLYRMSGDWLLGTEATPPNATLQPGRRDVVGRRLRLLALAGHTDADLAVYDEASGVLFAGDLVFNERAPTTPHADIDQWLASLDRLEAITREPGFRALVPGHGEVARDARPIERTRAWLVWLRRTLREAAAAGLDMNEAAALPLPPEFRSMPLATSEYRRSVTHLYPALEEEVLHRAPTR